jgi:hypothetical protein
MVILFLMGVSTSFSQQYLMNEAGVIQKNKVKSMVVDNCLVKEYCYRDHYDFNDCGKVSKEYPAAISSWLKSEYDENCQLKNKWRMRYLENSKDVDSIYAKITYFEKDGKKYSVLEDPDSPTGRIDTSTVFVRNYEDLKKNENKQTISYKTGLLLYPCGIEYKGPNHFKYTYQKNGLIDKADIYDEKGELVLSLKYTYLY